MAELLHAWKVWHDDEYGRVPLRQAPWILGQALLWPMRAGEIIPQALCTRYGLAIGAYSAWFVRALMVAVGVVSWPISKVLDHLLGSEHGVRITQP